MTAERLDVAPARSTWRGTTRARLWPLVLMLTGACGAMAFPLVIPALGTKPCNDFWPRELAILVPAWALYRICLGAPSLRRRSAQAWLIGVGYFALLIWWIDVAMARFGGMPQWQAVPALVGLVGYCAAFWALVPLVFTLLRRTGLAATVAFPCAVVTTEWFRSIVTGFPWGLWGYSQARNTVLLQLVSLAGVYGLSWLIAWVAALLEAYRGARHTRQAGRRGLWVIGAIAAAFGLGWALLPGAGVAPEVGPRVAIVQGNIEQRMKNRDAEFRETIWERYMTLSHEAMRQGAQIVIWPEGAWPISLGTARKELRMPRTMAPFGAPLLVGAVTFDTDGPLRVYNSALWADAKLDILGRYDKQRLVPFGEYVPWRAVLPVEKLVPGLADYTPGTSSTPLGPAAVGVLICYDGVFPELSRAAVRAGATWLANLTNDGWYGVSSAPYQHRDFYIVRAVETGRWVARAANSGVSFFVDPQGRLHGETALHSAAVTLATVPPRSTLTPYVYCGDWLVAICLGLLVGALGVRAWGRYAAWGSGAPGKIGSTRTCSGT